MIFSELALGAPKKFMKNPKKRLIYFQNCDNITVVSYVFLEATVKKAKFVFLFILLCSLVGLLMQSCEGETEERRTGVRADDAAISSVRMELEDRKNSLLAAEGDVFWTESGTLWHSTYTCSYLSRSKDVIHGSLEDALLAGKTGACSRCFASSSSDGVWEALESRKATSGDVFFVRGGDEYHRSAECEALSGCDSICSGNLALARALGFSSECPLCAQLGQ